MSGLGPNTASSDRPEGAERKVSDVRNVLLNWGAFLVAALSGLYLAPRLVNSLGANAYGVWALVGSLVGPLTLLDFGVRSAVTRLVARAYALGEHARASDIASTARVLYMIAGAIAVLVALVLSMGLTRWFKVPPDLATAGRLIMVMVGAALAANLATGLYGGVLTAVRRLDLLGIAGIAQEFARVALVLLVLWGGGGLLGLAIVTLALSLARYFWQRTAAHAVYPELRVVLRKPTGPDVRMIMDISVFATVIYSLSTVTAQISVYVIGALLPLSMVTFHAVGATLPIYVHAMSLPVAQNVLPQSSQMDARGGVEELRSLVLTSGRLGALALLPVVLAFMTRGPTFLSIWMGPEFREQSGGVLIVLSIATTFGLGRHVLQTVFIGTGRHRQLIPWYVGEAILTIVLSVLFVREWGIIGGAWATVTPIVLVSGIVFPILVSRSYGIPARRLWANLWLRPIVALVPYAALSWYTDQRWPTTTYLGFFGQVAAILPVALAGAWAIGVNRSERAQLTAAVGDALVRARRVFQ